MKLFTQDQVRSMIDTHGTPLFVYSHSQLAENAHKMLRFQAPYGLTVRYAMKANPHPDIIKQLSTHGIGIDASSGFEADIALACGVKAQDIQITAQQLPDNFSALIKKGVLFNACSLNQLEEYGKISPRTDVGVRINPGAKTGAGLNARLTTAGLSSSFGIWHEYIDDIHTIAQQYDLTISMVHTHAGTGADPKEWLDVTSQNMEIAKQFPEATKTSIGGGFKVGRMPDEETADIDTISPHIAKKLEEFYHETGRKLHLEVEPGSFLAVNIGILLAEVIDVKDTGADGYNFLIVNTGMTDILRPALYGAQHPLHLIPKTPRHDKEAVDYAVAGHCCESGDMFTVKRGDPETLEPRTLPKAMQGDYIAIEDTGAYCASMCASGYNSFPRTKEILAD